MGDFRNIANAPEKRLQAALYYAVARIINFHENDIPVNI